MTYHFTIELRDVDTITDDMADKLYYAGCDDATLSAREGRCYARFARKAPSGEAALLSAIKDIENAGFTVDTDGVGIVVQGTSEGLS